MPTPEIDQLLQRLEDHPEEIETYLDLANAFDAIDDPRSTLIRIQAELTGDVSVEDRLRLNGREALLVARRNRSLLGDHPMFGDELRVHYKLGFIDSVTLEPTDSTVDASVRGLVSVLGSQDAALMRALAIDPGRNVDYLAYTIVAELAAAGVRAPQALRTLHLTSRSRYGTSYAQQPRRLVDDDLTGLLTAFPATTELRLDFGCGVIDTQPFISERLRRFTWLSPYFRRAALEPLARSRLPALEAFTLGLGAHYAYSGQLHDAVTASDLLPVLRMLDRCTELRELGITNYAGDFVELANAIGEMRMIERLEILDVSDCTFDDAACEALYRLVRRAPRLTTLRVEHTWLQVSPRVRLVSLPITLDGRDLRPSERRHDIARYRVYGDPKLPVHWKRLLKLLHQLPRPA